MPAARAALGGLFKPVARSTMGFAAARTLTLGRGTRWSRRGNSEIIQIWRIIHSFADYGKRRRPLPFRHYRRDLSNSAGVPRERRSQPGGSRSATAEIPGGTRWMPAAGGGTGGAASSCEWRGHARPPGRPAWQRFCRSGSRASRWSGYSAGSAATLSGATNELCWHGPLQAGLPRPGEGPGALWARSGETRLSILPQVGSALRF